MQTSTWRSRSRSRALLCANISNGLPCSMDSSRNTDLASAWRPRKKSWQAGQALQAGQPSLSGVPLLHRSSSYLRPVHGS